jgi:dolichol-phosphate mannosyltransferase
MCRIDSPMMHRVDIIVPVFNEPENFRAFYDFLAKHIQSSWRLFVIYDFESDSTLQNAKAIADRDPRVCLLLNRRRGALNAIKTGIQNATCEAVLIVMVDDPPGVLSQIDEMTEVFYREQAAIVVASRYMLGGKHRGGPVFKGLLSRFAGFSLRWFIALPVHDATYATRLYRKSFLDSITIESKRGFEVALETTLKAHIAKRRIVEVPVSWEERSVGKSRFKILQWLPSYLYWYWYGIRHYWFGKFLKKSQNARIT